MQKTFKLVNKEINKLARVDIRFLFLIGLLITLPGVESLKNIFAFLFVVSWVVVAKKNNDWGGKWRVIDSIFLLWILADIFVSINAIITYHFSGSGVRDIIRFVLIAWALSRTNFSKERLTQSALVALVAVVLTLIYSYYAGHGELKELYSVGHINHTAIYLVIAYAISLALLLFNFNNLNSYQKIILVVTTIVLMLTTIDTGSRATFLILIIITLFDFFYLLIKVRKLYLVIGVFVVVTFIGVFSTQYPRYTVESFEKKTIVHLENFLKDSAREQIREFSYYTFRTYPLFGIGFGNFGNLSMYDIKAAIIRDKGVVQNNL